jgi:hypothetical protein
MAKKEALTVSRFINEVLINQLEIPLENIVNDTPFKVSQPAGREPVQGLASCLLRIVRH